jgi:L-alanine-DL-glutamate epimerase-like enolase superfamily enzyme
MKIQSVSIWALDIPLRMSFKHSLASRTRSSSLLLKVTLDDGSSGYGEALPREYVTGETVESCIAALRSKIIPRLALVEMTQVADIEAAFCALLSEPATAGDLAAICAVELAILDAMARSRAESIYSLLGHPRTAETIRYSMVIGTDSEKALRGLCWFTRLLGFSDIKVKVDESLERNRRKLEAVRSICPGARLRVDVNCAWRLDDALRNLDMMQGLGIVSCEQPLEKLDVSGHAELVRRYPDILICADESLCSLEDARNLINEHAATAFNIRLSKNGGLLNSLRIYRMAQESGIACQLGAQVGETAVISAAGRYFAGMTGDLRFHEGSFGTWLLKSDVTRKPYRFGYAGAASTQCAGSGLGVAVIEDRFAAYCTSVCRLDLSG